MRCYLFNLFSKALFCIFGHANQSHIREWVAQKIIRDFACIKCTIACRSWPLPSTYFFLYSPRLLLYSSLIAPAWVFFSTVEVSIVSFTASVHFQIAKNKKKKKMNKSMQETQNVVHLGWNIFIDDFGISFFSLQRI